MKKRREATTFRGPFVGIPWPIPWSFRGLAYSHVQRYWVHDAGPWTVFDWPERYGAYPRFRLQGGEWVSLEFATTTAVPEWGGAKVRMMREEDLIVREDGRVNYLSGPQRDLWLIR